MNTQVATQSASALSAAMAALNGYADGGKPFLSLNGSTGVYYFGSDDKVIDNGTEVVFDMKSFRAGWVCWKDSKVVEEIMANPLLGEKPKNEADLKDHGPYDDEQDGWKKQVSIGLRFLDLPGNPEATFNISSMGGVKAVTDFFKLYLQEARLNGDSIVPVVALDTSFYMPKDAKRGKKYFPVLTPAEWTTEEKLMELYGAAEAPENYAKTEEKPVEAPAAKQIEAPAKAETQKQEAPVAKAEAPAEAPAAAAAPGGRRRRF